MGLAGAWEGQCRAGQGRTARVGRSLTGSAVITQSRA